MTKLKNCKTYIPPVDAFEPRWHLLDAAQLPLGRLANAAAKFLIGKHRPLYTPHQAEGDRVIVINAAKAVVTGNKEKEKTYYRHSGYIGNLKKRSLSQQRALDSRRLVYLAVKGMLPKNKLQALRLNRLKIYNGSDHPHAPQQPIVHDLSGRKKKGK